MTIDVARVPRVECLAADRFELEPAAVRELLEDWRYIERRGWSPAGTTDELLSRLTAGKEIRSPHGLRYRGLGGAPLPRRRRRSTP